MSFTTVSTGQVIQPTDFSQFSTIFNAPPGNIETGHYFIAGNFYTTNAAVGNYITTRSRGPVPLSCSVNTADKAPGGSANSPTTSYLTFAGVLIIITGSAASTNGYAGGFYTIQY